MLEGNPAADAPYLTARSISSRALIQQPLREDAPEVAKLLQIDSSG
jgi:hypothetical protein